MLLDQSTFYNLMSHAPEYGMARADLMICVKTPKNAFWFNARPIGGDTQVVLEHSVADKEVTARIDAVNSRGIYQTKIMLAVPGTKDRIAFLWAAYRPIDPFDTTAYMRMREAAERMNSAVPDPIK